MAQEQQLTPEQPKQPTLATLLRESKKLLSDLRKEVTSGQGILDPNSQKKRELFVRLTLTMEQLKEQWKALSEIERKAMTSASTASSKNENKKIRRRTKARRKLKSAIRNLKEAITGVTDLTLSTEKDTKSDIDDFNDEAIDLNKEMSSLLREYSALKKNHTYVTRLEYGKDLSTYLTYGTAASKATVTMWLAWIDTLGEATKAAGAIFYPISATFTTLTKLFVFLGSVAQIFIAQSEAQKQEADEIRKLELENAKALLKKSAMFKFISFSLSFLSILAFAGILATPAGWALVAGATLVDWIDEGIRPAFTANKNLKKFKKDHEEELTNLETPNPYLGEMLGVLEQKAKEASSKAKWGAANVAAMVLIACGPIPVVGAVIGLIGLGVFGIVTVRNVYVLARPYVESYFSNRPLKKEYEEIPTLSTEKAKSEIKSQPTVVPLARPTTSSRSTSTRPNVTRGEETSFTHPFLRRRASYNSTEKKGTSFTSHKHPVHSKRTSYGSTETPGKTGTTTDSSVSSKKIK